MISKFEKLCLIFISFIFHPIFLPIYALYLILHLTSQLYLFNNEVVVSLFFLIFIFNVLLPALVFSLIYFSGLIASYNFSKKQERLLSSIIMLIFYLFLDLYLYKVNFPFYIKIFFTAMPLLIFSLLIIQSFYHRISIHLFGIGALIGVIFFYRHEMSLAISFSLFILPFFIAGLTTTARLVLNAHNYKETILGLISGIALSYTCFYVSFAYLS